MKQIFLLLLALASFLNPLLSLEKGSVVEIYFSPEDHVADHLISHIRNEQESIRIAVYCLMHTGIAKAISDAFDRGVDVELIIDPFSIKSRSPVARMVEKGIPIYVWHSVPGALEKNAQKNRALMHDKFCVFGSDCVWTGSFNFTRDAALNHRENVVILEGEDVASAYLNEFEAIKDQGCLPYSVYMKKMQSQKTLKKKSTR